MRTAMLVIAVLLLAIVPPARASIVIHDGAPGIVAESQWQFLDSFGHVWRIEANGDFHRQAEWDPPMPVADIKFWADVRLVTMDDRFFWYDETQHVWINVASWSAISDAEGSTSEPADTAAISPNPTPGPCRVSFSLVADGPVSVDLIDATGRLVRHLLDGPHPAGDYSLKWDGRDDGGRELPAGVYFTHLTTGRGTTTGRVVLAK